MTECNYNCERTVPISCTSFDSSNPLDPERFHIIFIKSGSIWFSINGTRCYATKNSVLCVSKPFRFEILHSSGNLDAVHFSFAPEFIHFDLNWERILSPKYKDECERFHFPTFDIFLKHDELFQGVITIDDDDTLSRFSSYLNEIRSELEKNPNQIWACMSRLLTFRIFRTLDVIRSGIQAVSQKNSLFLQMQLYIQNHMHEKLTVEKMCKQFMTNRKYLNDFFHANVGMTFSDYVDKQRLDMVCENLAFGELPLTVIMERAGYKEYSNFSAFFKKKKGVTPLQFRKMAKDERNLARNQKI